MTQEIQQIIDKLKSYSNSLERNKTISKLEDALAWAYMLDRKFDTAPPIHTQCTCPIGAIDKMCSVHGS